MNGFKTLFLLLTTAPIAFAQVETGKERDYGWSVNPEDGVLEYIVQIKPEEVRAMQERSFTFPNGQEDVSNIPRELVGRIARVVVRIGNEVLPRSPSLEELERLPPINSPLNPSSTALLGPGRMQDVEGNVFNIQRDAAPSIPDLPSSLGGTDAGRSRDGNLIDEASKAANAASSSVSDALSSVMPSASDLAQNFNSQNSGGGFLDAARGTGSNSKFNNTAPPVNAPAVPLPNNPTATATNPPFPNAANNPLSNPLNAANNSTTKNPANPLGANTANNQVAAGSYPAFPDSKLNPPSLANPTGLPQQQTPAAGFGTSPGLTNRPSTNWNNTASANTNPQYPASTANPASTATPDPYWTMQQYQNSPQYAATQGQLPQGQIPQSQINSPQFNTPNFDRVAMNNATGGSLTNGSASGVPNNQTVTQQARGASTTNPVGSTDPLDRGFEQPKSIDGILQVLFLLSLVVNFYLGILIRKLLMRYRSLLTNVRQAAYT